MIPRRRHTALALLAILIPATSFGWGRDGHRIIGHIAEQFLTPNARAAVRDLLGDQSLADASTWADEIKRNPAYKWASPLHYANVDPGHDRFSLDRDCPQKHCVVSAIIEYSHVLRNANVPRQERVEALKFLVHFVGDVHQPLHVSYARDRGGNDIKVTFFENRTNLHRVWDSGMIRRDKKSWQQIKATFFNRFAKKHVTENATGTDMNEIVMRGIAELARLDPVAWATESFKLAESNAYLIPDNGELGQAYFKKNIPVVEQRLAIAGVRLAAMLNEVFDDTRELPTGLSQPLDGG